MYLGLDLRGGVHFLLQVDMKGALTKRLDSTSADLRTAMRDKNLRHAGIGREGERIVIRFRDAETRDKAKNTIADSQPDLILAEQGDASEPRLVATLKPEAIKRIWASSRSSRTSRRCTTGSTNSASPSRSSSSRAPTASSSSCRACRTRPRPRTSSAAPRRSKSAWSTTRPAPSMPRWPATRPSAPRSTTNAAASRCWSRSRWC